MKTPLLSGIVLATFLGTFAGWAQTDDLGGVKVTLDDDQGAVTLRTELVEPFKLRIEVDAKGDAKPGVLLVDLPVSGRNVWPAADVEVRDGDGKALPVQRSGIEWHQLHIPLPAGAKTCVVQAVEPPGGWPKSTSERERSIQDEASGLRLRIANWQDGREAALSIRFDDSHPTHLSKAVPILDEYGFRGTFMINPGDAEPGSRRTSSFAEHRAAWEALATQGDHELANHSAHHRGGLGDDDMEAEIGDAARAIWALTPGRSQLMALNLGGGTRWETTRTLRYYLDKYHQFDAGANSTGMDDSYGNRVENFRKMLAQHLERGLWLRVHYHYIGDGLSSSEANFRAALDIAKTHADRLWIAGMTDIYQYQSERNASKLTLVESGARKLVFQLNCTTDAALYDEPLTIEVATPTGWDRQKVVIKDGEGSPVPARSAVVEGADGLRFEVAPRDGSYTIELVP